MWVLSNNLFMRVSFLKCRWHMLNVGVFTYMKNQYESYYLQSEKIFVQCICIFLWYMKIIWRKYMTWCKRFFAISSSVEFSTLWEDCIEKITRKISPIFGTSSFRLINEILILKNLHKRNVSSEITSRVL